jgi:hypothetical protein
MLSMEEHFSKFFFAIMPEVASSMPVLAGCGTLLFRSPVASTIDVFCS